MQRKVRDSFLTPGAAPWQSLAYKQPSISGCLESPGDLEAKALGQWRICCL